MPIALLVMHEAGWVHRDISVGNLYLYKDPVTEETRGLIGDFEYAKEVGWGGKHDIRTVCVSAVDFYVFSLMIFINRGHQISWP